MQTVNLPLRRAAPHLLTPLKETMKKLLLASLLLLSTLPPAFAQIMGMTPHHVFAPPHPLPAGSCTSDTVIGSNGDTVACTH